MDHVIHGILTVMNCHHPACDEQAGRRTHWFTPQGLRARSRKRMPLFNHQGGDGSRVQESLGTLQCGGTRGSWERSREDGMHDHFPSERGRRGGVDSASPQTSDRAPNVPTLRETLKTRTRHRHAPMLLARQDFGANVERTWNTPVCTGVVALS